MTEHEGGGRLIARPLTEVARDLAVEDRWLRGFVRAKQIPALRSGRTIRFDALALRALEEALRCPSGSSGERIPPRTIDGIGQLTDRSRQRIRTGAPTDKFGKFPRPNSGRS